MIALSTLYARQLETPTFGKYNDLLHQINPDERFEDILLELRKSESAQRQGNQNKHRLKDAGFPYCKTIEELDGRRYDSEITETFPLDRALQSEGQLQTWESGAKNPKGGFTDPR